MTLDHMLGLASPKSLHSMFRSYSTTFFSALKVVFMGFFTLCP